LTFRTFATADEIFTMLAARYELAPPEDLSPLEMEDWRSRKLLPTQNRVLMCLTTWLEDYSMLNEDPHISQRMQDFLGLITQPASLALAARLILASLERLVCDLIAAAGVQLISLLDLRYSTQFNTHNLTSNQEEEEHEGQQGRTFAHGSWYNCPAFDDT
jgi:hypothetical protein